MKLPHSIGILYHSCKHGGSGEGEGEGFSSCDPDEIGAKLRELGPSVIVGVYDQEHLELYRRSILMAGLNPLKYRVVDRRWGEQAVEDAAAALAGSLGAADIAPTMEVELPVSRRDLLRGRLGRAMDRVDMPVVFPDRCGTMYKRCDACVNACPSAAISKGKGGISIDYSKCTSCGLCSSACPFGAIQSPSFTDDSALELSDLSGTLTISCYRDAGPSVKLACISYLAPEQLATLSRKRDVMVICPDASCPLSKFTVGLAKAVAGLSASTAAKGLRFEVRGNEVKESRA